MKQYFYFWRLGWVAFVALFLCAFGINIVGKTVLFLTGIEGDEFTTRMGVMGLVFVVFGLPYAGWVFSLAVKKAEVLVPPRSRAPESDRSDPAANG